ncbi:hypothetical protein SAMD00023353_1002230 [Rosellinia necatrix]|uniref:Uncharacterized protein n=1 Tax=Rosellinia necatrix TaxID=77044 RepID=A0A1S8A6L8_ROSNE|nr:hypothetical protein SAMD00023353_1002230 [Rosellinia necatrix]
MAKISRGAPGYVAEFPSLLSHRYVPIYHERFSAGICKRLLERKYFFDEDDDGDDGDDDTYDQRDAAHARLKHETLLYEAWNWSQPAWFRSLPVHGFYQCLR